MHKIFVLVGCFLSRLRKERGYATPVDGEIKSVTKNINTKLGLLVYWGYWGSILRIPKLSIAKNSNTFYFAVE